VSAPLTGGCLCGAVRYRVAAEPLRVTHCHCAMCRRHGGSAFQTWLSVPAERLVFESGAPRLYRASEIAERGHCAACGTPLTFQYLAQRERISVSAGSLDHPETVQPTGHVWAHERLPWLPDDGLPQEEV